MADSKVGVEVALAQLRARAAEHESSKNEEYQEYSAGISDAIKALEPYLGTGSATPSREQIERVVSSYGVSPMLVDELMHLMGSGGALKQEQSDAPHSSD